MRKCKCTEYTETWRRAEARIVETSIGYYSAVCVTCASFPCSVCAILFALCQKSCISACGQIGKGKNNVQKKNKNKKKALQRSLECTRRDAEYPNDLNGQGTKRVTGGKVRHSCL